MIIIKARERPLARAKDSPMSKKNAFKKLKTFKPSAAYAIGAATLLFISAGLWALTAIRAQLLLRDGEEQLKDGFAALAAESLDPVRTALIREKRGCAALVAAYTGAHRPERLEWAAQACMSSGIDSPEIEVGLAAARELAGHDEDALKILKNVALKFNKSAAPLYEAGQILRRDKKVAEAVGYLKRAADLEPSNSLYCLDALRALSEAQIWNEARRIAEQIKNVATNEPETRLIIATALLRGGDRDGAMAQATQAIQLLPSKDTDTRETLEQTYPEALALADRSRDLASRSKSAQ